MTTIENRSEPRDVRLYDFRRPQRLTGLIRERFGETQNALAAVIGRALSDELNREVPVAFQEATEDPAGAILAEAANPAWALRAGAETEGVLCGVEAPLAQAFVEMSLGGPGALRPVDRPPTAIELSLLERIALRLGEALFQGNAPEGNSSATVLYLDGEARAEHAKGAGVIGVFDVTFGEESGALRFFYPYESLTSLFHMNLSAVETVADGKAERMTREHVGAVPIGLRVRLHPTPVRISDIMALRVGDVLSLDRPITDPVEIRIGDRLAYYGHPGRVDDRIGVQIARNA
ncbi:MAG: FliM/FliN family flagellar motor switch protein [Candidatus Eisenbacteria bacterium]|nr:FliM/FliN family flagellar motor switch protein [Candidatus Eisenbacteria bacterium]